MDDGLVEMVVESVRVHMLSSRHVVILKETGRERYLPIWIGPWEASAIAMRLQGLTPERPLTHDLFASTLERLGVRVAPGRHLGPRRGDVPCAAVLERDGKVGEIDARPSDALALAVRVGRADLRAAVGPRPGRARRRRRARRGGRGGGRDCSNRPASARRPAADVFRDFVNSLDVDPESEGRQSQPAARLARSDANGGRRSDPGPFLSIPITR